MPGETQVFSCPSDPTPTDNYAWRFYNVQHLQGSAVGRIRTSYMASEYPTWLLPSRNVGGVADGMAVRISRVLQPATLGYMTDGTWIASHGNWHAANRYFLSCVSWTCPRIDWDHAKAVNVLFGDGHAGQEPMMGLETRLRNNPYSMTPSP
jgi:prepilin-type processing-associated H-X9-DG protein